MKSKTVMFAPHMAPLARIAEIAGLSFASGMFKQIPNSGGIVTEKQLQNAIGAASVIPLQDIKKLEHLNEINTTTTTLIEALGDSETQDPKLITQLTEQLIDANNQLTRNYHANKHNGAGEHQPHKVPGAGARDREHGTEPVQA